MDKWYWIGMGLFLAIMAAGAGYSEHTKGQCKIETIKAGKSAEDIVKICGR